MSEPVSEDTLDHLWNAAQEFLRAMRTLVDAADEFVSHQRETRADRDEREPRVHRIDIDADVW